jgi:NAD(P)-dependent dehydrogenase (short-subunit alcohol dehydrogenase family)
MTFGEFSIFETFFLAIFYAIFALVIFIAFILMLRFEIDAQKKRFNFFKLLLNVNFRNYMQGRPFYSDVKLDGKVAIVTGANTGIGKETAIDLAKRGAKVYIACRDVNKSQEALIDIKSQSGNDNVHFLQLDLASLESVREFSTKFHKLETKLHILINNAGVMLCPQMKTKDGHELHFGTNHLGHFLLTNLLLDVIKAAAPSRIVVVSSLAHIFGKIRKHDLNNEKFYVSWLAYSSSKLANILFANELSRRLEGTGVVVNSCHPGLVHSNLQRHVNNCLRFYNNYSIDVFIFKLTSYSFLQSYISTTSMDII